MLLSDEIVVAFTALVSFFAGFGSGMWVTISFYQRQQRQPAIPEDAVVVERPTDPV
jgi:hypothetical protein